MVVVAHPDDEVIGVGGQLIRWGSSAVLVHATDGAPPDGRDAHDAGFSDIAAYAAARRRELDAALAWLPAAPLATVQLGATDQRVTHQLASVVRALDALITEWRPSLVITHAFEGGHPDHDALAVAAAWLRQRHPQFVHGEFAGYHESASGELVTNQFAPPLEGAVTLSLSNQQKQTKRAMLSAFESQQRTLAPFGVDRESLRVAPTYDFTQPPNGGRVWYERFNWGVDAGEWRRLVAAALDQRREDGTLC